MFKVGLTGGVGSGKSAIGDMFAELGAGIVDTDVIAREVVAPGEPGLAAVRAAFGDSVLTPSGELDRAALRARVFADPVERRRLEEILHPRIRTRALEGAARLEAPYVIIVVPLLVETGFGALVDRVLVVDCAPDTQLRRLMQRDHVDRAQAQAMLAAQTDRATRLAAADDVIDNEGSRAQARAQVENLHRRYLEHAGVYHTPRGRAE